jgi:hypothetical protein
VGGKSVNRRGKRVWLFLHDQKESVPIAPGSKRMVPKGWRLLELIWRLLRDKLHIHICNARAEYIPGGTGEILHRCPNYPS